MSTITTHVLDTARGCPAEGIAVALLRVTRGGRATVAEGATDPDGRITDLLPEGPALEPGTYVLRFETGVYFARLDVPAFSPWVEVAFEVTGGSHYHVPLLLSPFGYSTYRGS